MAIGAENASMHLEGPYSDEHVPLEDRRLLDQLRAEDAEAGRRFVHGYHPAVYRYLLYLAGQPDVAEDLAQETFLQAWRHLDTFHGRSSLQTWLLRIARREFLQLLRRRRRLTSLEELADPPASPA